MVVYVPITGVILERPAAAAESDWEECGYLSVRGGGHGEADVGGRGVAARGRYGWGGSVEAFAVVAAICTSIGGGLEQVGVGEGCEIYTRRLEVCHTANTRPRTWRWPGGGGECEGGGRMREGQGRCGLTENIRRDFSAAD